MPSGIERLATWTKRLRAGLVIIDTLAHALEEGYGATSHGGVQRVLRLLGGMAERTGSAVVVVRHLGKAGAKNARYRGHGSIGITGTARSVLQVTRDPDDASRRVLACVKPFDREPPVVAYGIATDAFGRSRIEWMPPSPAHAAPVGRKKTGPLPARLEAAQRFLREHLAAGPRPSAEILRLAAACGIAEKTLRRAQGSLGVNAFSEKGAWRWALPTGVQVR